MHDRNNDEQLVAGTSINFQELSFWTFFQFVVTHAFLWSMIETYVHNMYLVMYILFYLQRKSLISPRHKYVRKVVHKPSQEANKQANSCRIKPYTGGRNTYLVKTQLGALQF